MVLVANFYVSCRLMWLSQVVNIKRGKTTSVYITAGVSQSFILSPILSGLFINGLFNEVKFLTLFIGYADDRKLFHKIECIFSMLSIVDMMNTWEE